MKIKFSSLCRQCLDNSDHTKKSYDCIVRESGDAYIELEINDKNLYQIKCSKGHSTYMLLGNPKFELLFDMGAMALIDGYTKECVSTLSSSLERFIEFYLKIISIKKDVTSENFIKSWKLLSKQSERQLGAFYILQLSEYGETKFVLENKLIEFRNRVIHQGYIPSSEEAIEYGEKILQLINSILFYLKDNDLETLKKVRLIEFKEAVNSIPKHHIVNSTAIPSIINMYGIIDREEYEVNTFRASLESIPTNVLYKHYYAKKN